MTATGQHSIWAYQRTQGRTIETSFFVSIRRTTAMRSSLGFLGAAKVTTRNYWPTN